MIFINSRIRERVCKAIGIFLAFKTLTHIAYNALHYYYIYIYTYFFFIDLFLLSVILTFCIKHICVKIKFKFTLFCHGSCYISL